jgi:O-antigen ligase
MFLPLVALVHENLRRILLAVILLEMVLVIDVNLAFREDPALFGAVGGFNLSLTTLALTFLYASWLIGFLARERSAPRRIRLNGALLLYLACVAVSMTTAYDEELSRFEMFMLAQVFLVHVYVASAVRSRRDVLFVVTLLLAGALLEALMMLGTAFLGRDITLGVFGAGIDPVTGRVGGTFGSPNGAAGYLVLLLAPSASLLLARVSGWHKVLAMATFTLGAMSLIWTLSRGAWIALALSMAIVGLGAWRRGYISLKGPLLLGLALMLLALPFLSIVSDRLLGDDQGSARSRVPLAILAYRVIEDYPWLGLGPNNFALIEKTYMTSEFAGEWFFIVHNKYLLVWAETGIAALLVFLWFLGSTLRRGWRQWTRGDPLMAPLALGFTAAIVAHMWHMFFEVFHRPQIQTLWVIAGLLIAMSHVNRAGDSIARAQAA